MNSTVYMLKCKPDNVTHQSVLVTMGTDRSKCGGDTLNCLVILRNNGSTPTCRWFIWYILWTWTLHVYILCHMLYFRTVHAKCYHCVTSCCSHTLFTYFSSIHIICPKTAHFAFYWLIPTDVELKFNMAVSLCRYQIVVEIIHATTISSLPQLKKQKGTKTLQFTNATKAKMWECNHCGVAKKFSTFLVVGTTL